MGGLRISRQREPWISTSSTVMPMPRLDVLEEHGTTGEFQLSIECSSLSRGFLSVPLQEYCQAALAPLPQPYMWFNRPSP